MGKGGVRSTAIAAPSSARGAPRSDGGVGSGSGAGRRPNSARIASEELPAAGRRAQSAKRPSTRAPEQIMQEMHRALRQLRVGFRQASPSLVKCEQRGVRFDLQISNLDRAEPAYAVKVQRVAGELGTYKELSAMIFAEMQL